MRAPLTAHGPLAHGSPSRSGNRLLRRPSTHRGRLSVLLVLSGLAVVVSGAVLVQVTGVSVLGAFAAFGLVIVVAGGFVALDAIHGGERSLFVFATLPLWLFAALLLVGELAFEH